MKNLKFNRGVTVLEVLLAIFVLLIGVSGVLTLFPVGVRLSQESNDQILAAMTAQNALAAVRAEVGIVERAKPWTASNTNGDVLNWDGTKARGIDTCGGLVTRVGGTLLDDRLEARYTVAGVTASGASDISLSTNVLGPGQYGDGWNNSSGNGTVELVRFIANSSSNPYYVTYTRAGATLNVGGMVMAGSTAGNLGSDIHGRGSTMWLPGDGQTPDPPLGNAGGKGIGAHANWMVTFDLDKIRTVHFANAPGGFSFNGKFGMNGYGSGTEKVNPGSNRVYGYVFLDGTLAWTSAPQWATTTSYPPTASGSPSSPVALDIPADKRYLTLAILNGDNSSSYDDGTFRDATIRLTTVTYAWLLNPKLATGETYKDDSAIMLMTSGNAINKPYRLDRYSTLSPSVAASWLPGCTSFPGDGVASTDTFKLVGARSLSHEWLTVPRQFYGNGSVNPAKYVLGKGAAEGYGYLVIVNRVADSVTTFNVHILVYKGYDETLPPEANAPPIAYFTTILSDTLLR